jgi:predicted aspartyl protease
MSLQPLFFGKVLTTNLSENLLVEVNVTTSALLDTGANVNVLPCSIGIELGCEWERQTTALSLTGNLAQYEARVVLIQAVFGQFKPVQLVFASYSRTSQLFYGVLCLFLPFAARVRN